MQEFPKHKIKPMSAKLSGDDNDISLEISIAPFELEINDYSETLDSSIRLENISLPADPTKLENNAFNFPINPEQGYIDGSIYFLAAHNPIDVSQIIFGKIAGNMLPVKLITHWVLEHENTGFKNFETEIDANIKL